MSYDKQPPQQQKDNKGQKPPRDSNAVKQRHQLGEPTKQDSVPGNKAP